MKSIQKYTVILLLFSASVFACNSNKTEEKGKEYTSTYVCPMHCEGSGSDSAGTCPVCGMDYVLNKENK
ncbi:MAG: hypothetical protein ACI8ZN_001168 [Bacteroidia bacterium]|jgi:hypothetical protein